MLDMGTSADGRSCGTAKTALGSSVANWTSRYDLFTFVIGTAVAVCWDRLRCGAGIFSEGCASACLLVNIDHLKESEHELGNDSASVDG
jgi:hypothetical protein